MVGRSRFPRFFFREGGKSLRNEEGEARRLVEVSGKGGGQAKFFKTRNKSGSAPYLDRRPPFSRQGTERRNGNRRKSHETVAWDPRL